MFKDFEKDNTGNIFVENLKDYNFNPSTIPNCSSDLDYSLAFNSTLFVASLTKLFGLKVRTPL